jgi:hypothetical protein
VPIGTAKPLILLPSAGSIHDADSHLAASNAACHLCFEGGLPMNTQNWIIAAVVVLLIVAGYFFLRPTAETPTAPPATTEQPAQPAPAN